MRVGIGGRRLVGEYAGYGLGIEGNGEILGSHIAQCILGAPLIHCGLCMRGDAA